uniref:Uncharacterized protein n=1 Tax=Fagus sylvatica TaxID=28930 RepID=A0A2N9FPN0_FAGSY
MHSRVCRFWVAGDGSVSSWLRAARWGSWLRAARWDSARIGALCDRSRPRSGPDEAVDDELVIEGGAVGLELGRAMMVGLWVCRFAGLRVCWVHCVVCWFAGFAVMVVCG